VGYDLSDELIEKCKAGDSRSQYRLYKTYSRAMYNICIRMVPNVEEAEDLLQESFISAFNNLRKFRKESSFGTWLKRIVINQCISYLRKKKVDLVYPESAQLAALKEDEDSGLMSDLSPEIIQNSIKQLPDGARIVLNMHLMEGYKHKEIAQLLNISESTSKSQYKRAKFLIKENILKKLNERD